MFTQEEIRNIIEIISDKHDIHLNQMDNIASSAWCTMPSLTGSKLASLLDDIIEDAETLESLSVIEDETLLDKCVNLEQNIEELRAHVTNVHNTVENFKEFLTFKG